MKFGIDISIYQKGMNLSQAMNEGVTFAILKAGGAECGKFKDSSFENFYSEAGKIGLPVGCYFFAKCTTPAAAIEEAKYFASIIKGKTFPLKCWYDIEASMTSLSKEALNSIAKAFCNSMAEAGYDCGVYASSSTFKKIDYDGSFSAKYPKWVAAWTKSKPSIVIEGRDMWQFGGETNLINPNGNKICGKVCDQDYCYFDFGSVTPVNPEPENTTIEAAKPTLRMGSQGAQVRLLQQQLISLGYDCGKYGADGIYGKSTKEAVCKMQQNAFPDTKSEWDGIYGPKSASALTKLLNS